MIEASIHQKRIEAAFSNREFIKIIFQYPASMRAVIKKGIVVAVAEDGFEFEEIFDGLVSYSYKYIVEIKKESECNGKTF
jgi:hypothetical protein